MSICGSFHFRPRQRTEVSRAVIRHRHRAHSEAQLHGPASHSFPGRRVRPSPPPPFQFQPQIFPMRQIAKNGISHGLTRMKHGFRTQTNAVQFRPPVIREHPRQSVAKIVKRFLYWLSPGLFRRTTRCSYCSHIICDRGPLAGKEESHGICQLCKKFEQRRYHFQPQLVGLVHDLHDFARPDFEPRMTRISRIQNGSLSGPSEQSAVNLFARRNSIR